MKASIDSKKTEIERRIKDAVQASEVACGDGSDATSPTDANVACRMTFSEESTAAAAEETLRSGTVDAAVTTALGVRRLGSVRRLTSSVAKSEGSQVLEEVADDTPTPTPSPDPTPDPTPGPSPPPMSDPTPDPTPTPTPAPSPSSDAGGVQASSATKAMGFGTVVAKAVLALATWAALN